MKKENFLIGFFLLFLFTPNIRSEELLPDLFITTADFSNSDVTLSKALPKGGDKITIRAKIHNKGETSCSDITVCFFREDRTKKTIPIGGKHTIEKIEPDKFVMLTQEWLVPKNGFYKIIVVIDPDNKIKEKDKNNNKCYFEVPVVSKELHFHYWACPKSTRYVTIKMFSKKNEEKEYWENRGVIPAAWRGGVCQGKYGWNEEEQFINYWGTVITSGYPAIAIDEFIEGNPICKIMFSALIKTKEKFPNLLITLATPGLSGSEESADAYRKAADLVLIERYFSSFIMYYGFNTQWEMAKKMGIADKTLFTLGLSITEQSWITTEQELLRQIKYIKKLAPEMNGLSFFGWTTEHLYESIDNAIFAYYIKPVIWIKSISSDKATITNIGGMDAENIGIEIFSEEPKKGGERIDLKKIEFLKVGEEKTIEISSKYLSVVPSEHYTILE